MTLEMVTSIAGSRAIYSASERFSAGSQASQDAGLLRQLTDGSLSRRPDRYPLSSWSDVTELFAALRQPKLSQDGGIAVRLEGRPKCCELGFSSSTLSFCPRCHQV